MFNVIDGVDYTCQHWVCFGVLWLIEETTRPFLARSEYGADDMIYNVQLEHDTW